jgi:hypothetical protein
MMVNLGHDGPPQTPWRENLITDDALAECPLRTLLRAKETDRRLTAEIERYDTLLFPAYEDGHLLVSGGLADQPARYVEMIRLFRETQALTQAKYDELTKPKDGER